MKFSGTLIEDLMATVERVEQRVKSKGSSFAEHNRRRTLGSVPRAKLQTSIPNSWDSAAATPALALWRRESAAINVHTIGRPSC